MFVFLSRNLSKAWTLGLFRDWTMPPPLHDVYSSVPHPVDYTALIYLTS